MRWLLSLVLLTVSGCGGFSRGEPDDIVVRVGDREVRVYRPASVTTPAPLVVMLHGGFGTGAQARRSYGWDAMAAAKGFVVAYPDGLSRSWNAGTNCCGPSNRDGVDDAAFLHGLREALISQGIADPKRVYATGMSNGAMMAYGWACAYPGDLAAIGPVAGTRVAECATAPALPVIAIHGEADANVPIGGGPGAGVTNVDYRSLAEALEPFQRAAQCSTPGSVDGLITRYDCAGQIEIVTVIIPGAGHQWPGSEVVRAAADDPYEGLDATAFLWAEFARY
jgi:polyhydroxybutyrate depolymerase